MADHRIYHISNRPAQESGPADQQPQAPAAQPTAPAAQQPVGAPVPRNRVAHTPPPPANPAPTGAVYAPPVGPAAAGPANPAPVGPAPAYQPPAYAAPAAPASESPAPETPAAPAEPEEAAPAQGKDKGSGDGKKGGGKKRIWLWVALGILAVLIGIGVKFIIDINNRAALFEQTPVTTPVPTATPEAAETAAAVVAPPTPSPTPDPEAILLSQADLEFMKNRVNILVLGVDESTERANWGSFRTDTMILVTIDFETNDVYMISIPRDSYVKLCGSEGNPLKSNGESRYGKINSAFSAGGGAQENGYLYSMNTVSHLFGGIPVNYYVGFNMNVVKEVVNAMGGVDYDVDIEINMNGRHLDTGPQHLDGQAVLDYCRQRKGDSDIKRVERQQKMLKAIFQQLKSTGQIVNIPSIYQAVEQNIQTNLTFTQISSLALMALDMDLDQLESSTVEGTGIMVGSSSCWGLYMNKLKNLIQEVFGIEVRMDMDMDVSNIRERIAAEQAAIAGELGAANAAVSRADSILSRYGDWLSEDARSNLNAWRDALQELVEDASLENVGEIVSATNTLNQLNNTILSQLGQYGQGGDIAPQPEVPEPPPVPDAPGDVPTDPPMDVPTDAPGPEGFEIPEVDPNTGLPIG